MCTFHFLESSYRKVWTLTPRVGSCSRPHFLLLLLQSFVCLGRCCIPTKYIRHVTLQRDNNRVTTNKILQPFCENLHLFYFVARCKSVYLFLCYWLHNYICIILMSTIPAESESHRNVSTETENLTPPESAPRNPKVNYLKAILASGFPVIAAICVLFGFFYFHILKHSEPCHEPGVIPLGDLRKLYDRYLGLDTVS